MNTTTNKTVVVTGATGQQGGSVTTALLNQGYSVRALTRNTSSASALALQDRGVEVVQGDFADQESLVAAASGVDSVFFMTTPFEAGVDAETKQGLTMIAALKEAGVQHVVYSSVASADKATGIPHFDSKYEVEKVLVDSGLNYTIVAPVYFMENLLFPQTKEGITNGTVAMAVPETTPLQQIAVSNIGEFVAAVIERGDAVYGQRYDIAGDELNGTELTSLVSGATHKDQSYMALSPEVFRSFGDDMVIMFEWFATDGYSTDIAALKRDFPEVKWKGFAKWAEEQSWN